jgi:hypothetical protein
MCLDTMFNGLQWDICDLFHLPIELKRYNTPEEYLNAKERQRERLQRRLQQQTTHGLRYSCLFWAQHLHSCKMAELKTVLDRLDRFFRYNLLDWMYLLSLVHSTGHPWTLIRRLPLTVMARIQLTLCTIISLTPLQDNKMTCWSKDLERFLKKHWNGLRENPLAVYHLFAFAPKSTVFQEFYSKLRSFPHPVVTMGLEDDWPALITIEPHAINTSCLSKCGSWLATGGKEANRAIYGIWNVESIDGETYLHPCGKFL